MDPIALHLPTLADYLIAQAAENLTDATRSIEVEEGTIARIPDGVHGVEALEPSVIVLTAISLPS